MNQLLWLRSDLRTDDNPALNAAMAAGPTVALYLITPEQWRQHDDAACKVDFWLRNLQALAPRLQALNVPLLIRTVPDWAAVPAALLAVCHEQRIAGVQFNDEYGVNETRRDAAAVHALATAGIACRRHLDQLLFAPGTILTKSGGTFQVYSQFRKACYAHLRLNLPQPLPRPRAQAPLAIAGDAPPSTVPGFAPPPESLRQLWPAGEEAAQRQLEAFAEQALPDYHEARDYPARPGTSRLSPYLAAGVLSPRQCLQAALVTNRGEFESGNAGATHWISELFWREFYRHILQAHPRLSMGRAFRPETEALAWRDAPDELAAWQEGRTGFPIIDAAMRCLQATGWMHNRLRMIVAMFLTKNLLIDWRAGERWFMRHLIDGDLAQNNGGWQWSASTGTDAAPYFRLFNPLAQSEKFDPDGLFIRQWVPELAALDRRAIHNPAALGGLFGVRGYPRPMVDLGLSRDRALAAFRHLPKHRS